jgi:hypothetical protein
MRKRNTTPIFFVCWAVTVLLVLGPMFIPELVLLKQIPFAVIVLLVVGMWAAVLVDIPRVMRAIRRRNETRISSDKKP